MKRVIPIPSYDFVGEVLSQEQGIILFCYYRSNQFSPQKLICIIFSDKHLTHGQFDWLVNKEEHPHFWDYFLQLTE